MPEHLQKKKEKKTAPHCYEARFTRMRRINKIVKLWTGKPKQRALQSESAVITFTGLDTDHSLQPYSYSVFFLNSSFNAPSDLHWDLHIVGI